MVSTSKFMATKWKQCLYQPLLTTASVSPPARLGYTTPAWKAFVWSLWDDRWVQSSPTGNPKIAVENHPCWIGKWLNHIQMEHVHKCPYVLWMVPIPRTLAIGCVQACHVFLVGKMMVQLKKRSRIFGVKPTWDHHFQPWVSKHQLHWGISYQGGAGKNNITNSRTTVLFQKSAACMQYIAIYYMFKRCFIALRFKDANSSNYNTL